MRKARRRQEASCETNRPVRGPFQTEDAMSRLNSALGIECELKVRSSYEHDYSPCLRTIEELTGTMHRLAGRRTEHVYFDTADYLLAGSGRTFRARTRKSKLIYAYKYVIQSLRHAIVRREMTMWLNSAGPVQIPVLELNNPLQRSFPLLRHLVDFVLMARGAPENERIDDLAPRARMVQDRAFYVTHDDSRAVELVLQVSVDRVEVTLAGAATPVRFSELEVELTRTYPGSLQQLDEIGEALGRDGYSHVANSKYSHAVHGAGSEP
jgi:hypothetical protein